MKYVDQSPSGLTFTHFTTPEAVATFDESALTVLQRRECVIHELQVETAIIGESHFVRIRGPDIELVELLACVDIRQHGFHPTHWARQILPSHRWQSEIGRWRIDARVRLVRHVDEAVRRSSEQSVLDNEVTLEATFPGPLSPKTLVGVSESSDALHIHTLHEYSNPDGGMDVVHSLTSLTLGEEG